MTLPLEGIKIIDFTSLQAGPACTQLLAWFGADVLKVERPRVGDMTRSQPRDNPELYSKTFAMLNSNKKSIELDTKTKDGKAILERLISISDVMVENVSSRALDRMGLTWEHIQRLNPRLVFGSIKGFNDNSLYADLGVYENLAQCAGGAASTTGFWDGPPTISGAALGDISAGMHLAAGIVTALYQREKTGVGQKVAVSMQDAVLNLCRMKLRDQERLQRVGFLAEYPQFPNGEFGDSVPRAGNAGCGGQPGWILKCKGWQKDPNAYIYFAIQEQNWMKTCDAIGHSEWKDHPNYSTARSRQIHIFQIFRKIEEWLADKTKFEAVEILRKFEVPCAPVLSMKDIVFDESLRASGSIVEVAQEERGKYLTVGSPIKFSSFTPQVRGAPLLGEHTQKVLIELGYKSSQIARLRREGVI